MSASDIKDIPPVAVRVWDIPTRLFHWLIVLLFAFSWWTAENDQLDWHMLSGYAILMLLIFRLYWGFAGSATARFSGFIRGPKAFFGYAARLFDRPGHPTPGHNPMGGWSVVAFILLLLAQVGLGLFAIDVDGLNAGPLDHLVSFETGRRAAGLHHRLFNFLLILTGLHIAIMIFYWIYKRENLIVAMITGRKQMPPATASNLRFVSVWWSVPGLLVAGLIVAWIVWGRF